MRLLTLYHTLLEQHGPQGWWPLLDEHGKSKYTGRPPSTRAERFEIAVGAILTQNTTWTNVERALHNLWREDLLEPQKLLDALAEEEERVKALIKPAGYYNQKARKLGVLARFFLRLGRAAPSRESLLALWGVGPETADSILLYAYSLPFFVIDAYTRRVLVANAFPEQLCVAPYDELQARFHEELPHDVALYKEFHALLVEEAKGLRRRKRI